MKGASNIAPMGLRLPDELKEAIKERARINSRSMNSEIVQILQDAINSGGLISGTEVADRAIRHVADNREALKRIIKELQIIAGEKT
jgi:plasmid stability protein